MNPKNLQVVTNFHTLRIKYEICNRPNIPFKTHKRYSNKHLQATKLCFGRVVVIVMLNS
jgi:hypothetical protein